MNILVLMIPIVAAGVFVALWASRSRSLQRNDGNGDGAVYFGGIDSARDNDDSDGGDAGEGGGDGGSDGGGGGGSGGD